MTLPGPGVREEGRVAGHSASQRAQQRRLREQMRGLGMSYAEIAAEMARRYKLRPRAAWRIAWGWTLEEAAERYNALRAKDGAQALASLTGSRLSEWENWPLSTRKPPVTGLCLLAEIYHAGVLDLIDVHDREKLPAAELLTLGKTGTAPEPPKTGHDQDAKAPAPEGPAGSAGVPDSIMAVAGESANYASWEAGRSVAPLSVVHLTAELQRLARSYSAMPPLEFVGQARMLRDESRRLSERTRKPVQLADLHLVTGGACGLLAMASWDLGAWSAAIEQAHAAATYGEIAGHHGLQAWAAGCEGLIVFWRGRPREAADVVASALELAPRGTARARLHCIAARAWAYLGAVDRVRSELAAADRAQDETGDACAEELHDEIGGEYGWDRARHAMCAATALLIAGDPAGAAVRAREAIALHAAGHAFSDLVSAKARADLACVELTGGALDAAEDALNPVWRVAPGFRRYPLVGRLESASAALGAPRYARSRPAVDLVERIRVFSAESAPALAARPMLPPGGQ